METPFGELPDRMVAGASMAECHEFLRARVSRRTVLKGAFAGAVAVAAGPVLWRRAGYAATPPAARHLAYGADPRSEMTVAWTTDGPVEGAVLDVGPTTAYGMTVAADSQGLSGTPTVYHRARVTGLTPGTAYHYRVRHEGAETADETFRTAPGAAQPFAFTAFGDQGIGESASASTAAVARIDPAFHFHVGDLCYAYRLGVGNPLEPLDLSALIMPIAMDASTWDAWLRVIEPQASRAPWMTTVGNHEMEPGYGSLGYDGYLARTAMPAPGVAASPTVYAFRYGNVGFIALDGNDVSEEITANHGYTGGTQDEWLRVTLESMRADPTIDFIVVGYHNCAYCTNVVHASDGGGRRWDTLFDRHSVDLVINGHNHSYERTHPMRAGNPTAEVPSGGIVEPASMGTTYVTAGGGGQVAYQVSLHPLSYVTVAPGLRIPELAPWSATRYLDLSFIAVDVVPPDASGVTTMTIRALRPDGTSIEEVTLRRVRPTASG